MPGADQKPAPPQHQPMLVKYSPLDKPKQKTNDEKPQNITPF